MWPLRDKGTKALNSRYLFIRCAAAEIKRKEKRDKKKLKIRWKTYTKMVDNLANYREAIPIAKECKAIIRY